MLLALSWAYPALSAGPILGPFDGVLSATSLGKGLFPSVHNVLNGDQVRQDAAWLALNWTALHHLQFPLWNPFNGLGLPEFLNFQSAVLSLPSLVAYLAPLAEAYTVSTVVKLVVAGLGAYAAARVLGLGRPAATFAGVVGELAGPLAAWVGWPHTGVAEWGGWILAAGLLLLRDPPTPRRVGALGLALAFAVYGGFPEVILLELAACTAVLLVTAIGSGRSAVRRLPALAAGAVLGAALSAPLWLPGVAAIRAGAAYGRSEELGLPLRSMVALLSPAYFGLPLEKSVYFGPSNYYETATYLGPVVLVAAAVAVLRAWRRPATWGLALTAAAAGLVTFSGNLDPQFVGHLPLVSGISPAWAAFPMATCAALLAGIGVEELGRRRTRHPRELVPEWLLVLGTLAVTAWLAWRATSPPLSPAERAIRLESLAWAFVLEVALAAWLAWPALGRVVAGRRRGRAGPATTRPAAVGLAALAVLQGALLVVAAAPVNTWGRRSYPETPAIASLRHIVGDHLLGFATTQPPDAPVPVGILPDANIAYRLHEFATYDATTQRSLELAWARSTSTPLVSAAQLPVGTTEFFPNILSARQAREFGVRYVLTGPGGFLRIPRNALGQVEGDLAGNAAASSAHALVTLVTLYTVRPDLRAAFPTTSPTWLESLVHWGATSSPAEGGLPLRRERGALARLAATLDGDPGLLHSLEAHLITSSPPVDFSYLTTLNGEELFRVADVHTATFARPSEGTVRRDLRFGANNEATVLVRATRGGWLDVRVAAEPGWRATVDGRPVALRTWKGAMLEVDVPAGGRVVELTYFPSGLRDGILLAVGAALAFAVAVAVSARRRRGRRQGRRLPGAEPGSLADATSS